MQVFILAKRIQYFYKSWAPACFEREMITKALFELRKEFPTLEFVGSFYDDRSKADHERLGPMSIPEGVKHIGKLNATQWDDAIKNSRLLMGVGWPTSSPSPYRALARGVPFLNPHNVNDRESEDDPSSWGFVQHDALRRISEPYVYNVQQHDYEAFVGAIRKALTTETPVYRLERMERHALDKRVSDFMEMDWYSEARQILEIRKAGKEENSVGGVGLLEM
jgi:hypothetical protein